MVSLVGDVEGPYVHHAHTQDSSKPISADSYHDLSD